MARIIVCGYMIRHPVVGLLLAYFQYVLGLHRLGHDVLYLEESGWPQSCYDPVAQTHSDDPSPGLRVVQELLADYGLKIPVCYVNRDSGAIQGADWQEVKRMLGAAELLLNVGGVCWLPEFHLCRRRALIDMDPFFTQVGCFATESLNQHHVHFSYGVNIGHLGCNIPTVGIDWHSTVPPVVPELWQSRLTTRKETATDAEINQRFTTIANWSAYGGITYHGEHYGQKDEEFLRLLQLPSHTSQRLELALSGCNQGVKERLTAAGWLIRDGGAVSTNLSTYRAYLAASRGELSVAKHAYVKSRSGWFSDRSVCYLAAGRPAILQDTGFSDWLPAGLGVLAFSSLKEAVDCIERVNADYLAHCLAARELAERFFSYKVVLPRLLETA